MLQYARVVAPYVFLAGVFLAVFALPDAVRLDGVVIVPELGWDSLPDAPTLSLAEKAWSEGRRDVALILADVAASGPRQRQGAQAIRERWEKQLREDRSPEARLLRLGRDRVAEKPGAGSGAGSGAGVGDFVSLSGVGVAEQFQQQPQRDLARQWAEASGVFARSPGLREPALAAGLFPQGEAALALAQALAAAKALSPSLEEALTQGVAALQGLPDVARMEAWRGLLLPCWDLAKETRSWADMGALVGVCDDPRQVSVLASLCALKPGNAAALAQVATVAAADRRALAQELLGLVMRRGQAGLDAMRAILHKGPAGLTFLLTHPEAAARLPLTGPAHGALWGNVVRTWTAFAVDNPAAARWCKLGMLAVTGLALLTLAARQAPSALARWQRAAQARGEVRPLSGRALALGGALLALAVLYYGLNQEDAALGRLAGADVATTAAPAADAAAPAAPAVSGNMWALFVLVFLLSLAAHYWLYWLARTRVQAVLASSEPNARRLALLDNLDIFFDLPMYFGLGCTIFAFLLITISGAESARYVAYTATFIGICNAAGMRVFLLQRARQALLRQGEGCPVPANCLDGGSGA